MTKKKTYGIMLLFILFGLSIFKDMITPDYLNTRAASFMNPAYPQYSTALSSHLSHPTFWLTAYVYSLLFIIVPSGIINFLVNKEMAIVSFYILLAACLVEYAFIYSGNTLSIVHVVPKINRYFHSPLLTLFLLASFTLLSCK
jgi:hypothetical protein